MRLVKVADVELGPLCTPPLHQWTQRLQAKALKFLNETMQTRYILNKHLQPLSRRCRLSLPPKDLSFFLYAHEFLFNRWSIHIFCCWIHPCLHHLKSILRSFAFEAYACKRYYCLLSLLQRTQHLVKEAQIRQWATKSFSFCSIAGLQLSAVVFVVCFLVCSVLPMYACVMTTPNICFRCDCFYSRDLESFSTLWWLQIAKR